MKRIQLIEYGIVVIGLIFGYKFIETVFNFLVQLSFELQSDYKPDSYVFIYLFLLTLNFFCFIVLIKKSASIAAYINKGNENDMISIKLNLHSVIQVVIIAVSLLTLLTTIGDVLLYLYEAFKFEVNKKPENFGPTESEKFRFKVAALKVIFAFLLLFFSKEVSSWFINKKGKTNILEITNETENNV